MTEVWKPISGFEGRYEVSNLGRVRSLKFRGNMSSQIMKTTPNYSGYHVVTLGKERKQVRVHCAVLEAFVGPRPEGHEGCHGDNDRSNNRLENLRWDTPKGNTSDRRSYNGSNNPNAKLTEDDWKKIADRRAGGETCKEIAKDYGVTSNRVAQISRKAGI